uniref:Methyltransferase n=1 Tax=Lactuca sativa TaxID=4236 RepID=A0A9R1VWB3_LACSA|nr:hypothetical protein LSAT_V11C400214310 [Lactuca sativa]
MVLAAPEIAWGKHTRVILDVGCGIANFGGYLFDKDVLAMSFAPRDDHEAQIQFALERGIPAISAIMGSQRLPFPSNVFDLVASFFWRLTVCFVREVTLFGQQHQFTEHMKRIFKYGKCHHVILSNWN